MYVIIEDWTQQWFHKSKIDYVYAIRMNPRTDIAQEGTLED
jgi:hypothetical protein